NSFVVSITISDFSATVTTRAKFKNTTCRETFEQQRVLLVLCQSEEMYIYIPKHLQDTFFRFLLKPKKNS
uniref:Uncharacterized protein n=1 Tax=Oryzias melastigma TaxID=30732 RepID=A0A3B3CTU6_ORYME